jgi:hypothetical protein
VRNIRCLSRLLGPIALGIAIVAPAASASAPPATVSQWHNAIEQVPTSGVGCYSASYPALAWRAGPCSVAPAVPLAPSPVALDAPLGPATVGDGNDDSAVVQGKLTHATGTFTNVSPRITETGQVDGSGRQVANTFTLQINSQFFSGSPACDGAADPSDCQAWEQFVYDTAANEVFIQYWLINYDTTCPAGYYSYSPDCYTNSPASTFSGGPLTAPELASTVFQGTAKSGGNDSVSLSDGGTASKVVTKDSKLHLAAFWNTTEWDVFGDGSGSQAKFGAGTTLEPVTTLVGTSKAAPSCVAEGFTGETNNLTLSGTPAFGTVKSPSMGDEQTNGSTTAATCATAKKAAK